MTKFLFSSREVSFHGAEGPIKQVGDFSVCLALMISEVNRELFVLGETLQREFKIVSQIGGVRTGVGLGVRQLLPKGSVIAVTTPGIARVVVGNAEKPCGKARVAAKTGESAVSLDECILCEIIRQRDVTPGKMAQELADSGLMADHERAECSAIVSSQHSAHELRVG